MITLKGDHFTAKDVPYAYFSSYEGKYIIVDNLDEKAEPIIPPRPQVYNADYVYVTIVLRGTLHIIVGGTELEVKANEYLAVMPCMSVEIKESKCLFFSFLTLSHLMGEIYTRTNVTKKLHFNAFKFRHMHFEPRQIAVLLDCYRRIKKEHQREDYPMKEIVLRAYQSAYIAKYFSLATTENIIRYNTQRNKRQYELFNAFIFMLNEKYKQERSVFYYAQELKITPKYLSNIVQAFTKQTASQVIDQYVVYSIKQYLYKNDLSIKAISEVFNFPSQSFFGRYFKRVSGVSPHQYIKQNNIKSINFATDKKVED
ncbi:MAG: AraC family transcriptional regulator [Bacteroidaceae bacterium]|nr:AraC family transcriptional regulator [Bacteroidaceae bacterium]